MPGPDLSALAARHLWRHFNTPAGGVPIITRGEGCSVWDTDGNEYLDGLAGLFVVQAGHGRRELAEAAAAQAADLAYFPVWGYAHPPAIELAARLASLAPADLNRVFFTSGGSEAVESAWKLARQYFRAIGQPERRKVVSRTSAYHGTTMGALSITSIPALKNDFEPLVPGVSHAATTNRYRCDYCAGADACTLSCADDIERMIVRAGPETVAAVFVEPVQNSGGCFTPADGYFARVREICDRHGVLLVSDEVICAYGRLGTMFGADRYGYVPDMITTATGLTSGYSPLGAVLVSDRIAEAFIEGGQIFNHGITFGGHPVSCAVAMANLDIFEREDLCGNVRANEDAFRAALEDLGDLPIVGDVRGAGYFFAVELVRDRDTKERFDSEVATKLAKQILPEALRRRGLLIRSDVRGDLILQLSPPLIAGQAEFDRVNGVLRDVLVETMAALG